MLWGSMAKVQVLPSTPLARLLPQRLPGEGLTTRWAFSVSGSHAAVASGSPMLSGIRDWVVRMVDPAAGTERWQIPLSGLIPRGLAVSDEGLLAVLVLGQVQVYGADGALLYTRESEDVVPAFLSGNRIAMVTARPGEAIRGLYGGPAPAVLSISTATTGESLSERPFELESSEALMPVRYHDGINVRPGTLRFDEVTGDLLSETRIYPGDGGPPRPAPRGTVHLSKGGRAIVIDLDAAACRAIERDGETAWSVTLGRGSLGQTPLLLLSADRATAMLVTFPGDVARVERLDLESGATTVVSGDGRITASDGLHAWPSNQPAFVSARGRLVRWDPSTASFVGEEALDLLALARSPSGLVTLHDDGVRWWNEEGQPTAKVASSSPWGRFPIHQQEELAISPDGTRVLLSGGAFGVAVLEPGKVVWRLPHAVAQSPRVASWVGAQHIVHTGRGQVDSVLVDLEAGAERPLSLGPGLVVGTPTGGIVRAWDKGVSFHDREGTVVQTWSEKKKPKGYEWPKRVIAFADEVWVQCLHNLFVWRSGAPLRIVPKEMVRDFVASASHVAVLSSPPQKGLRALLLDRASAEVVGAADVQACDWGHFLALSERGLDVATALGEISRVALSAGESPRRR